MNGVIMGSFSILHWIILAFISASVLSLFGARRSKSKSFDTYVIKQWFASETPNDNGELIHIIGRKSGPISYLLSLIGINPIVSLIVDRKKIHFRSGAWHGFDSWVIPTGKICSGIYGYAKPFWSSLFWILIGISLLIPTYGSSLILILVVLFYYYFNKTTKIGFTSIDGMINGFAFKRSLIEGKNIEESSAAYIIAIIEMIMLGNEKPHALNLAADTLAGAPGTIDASEQARQKMEAFKAQAMHAGESAASKVAASFAAAQEQTTHSKSKTFAPDQSPLLCPKCKSPYTTSDVFCGGCGHKLLNP